MSGAVDGDVRMFVADVVEASDAVDRGILDRVIRCLGWLAWFRHVYFENHVGLRFELAAVI